MQKNSIFEEFIIEIFNECLSRGKSIVGFKFFKPNHMFPIFSVLGRNHIPGGGGGLFDGAQS